MQWLLCKECTIGLNKNERILLQLSALDASPEIYKFIKVISHFHNNIKFRREVIELLIDAKWPLIPKQPYRYIRTFEPKLSITKVWLEKKKFPPKGYIGVGHNDSGSRSGSLAWQEIQSVTAETKSKESDAEVLLDFIFEVAIRNRVPR